MRPLASTALVLLFAAVTLAQADLPQPLLPSGAWSAALQEHPRLLGPRAHLQALAKSNPEAYRRLKTLMSDHLLATGTMHAVEGAPRQRIEPHLNQAMKNVQRGPTNIHQDTWIWLEQVAFTYDLFFDQIPPADRQKMIDWMNAHLAAFTTDENAFHNSTLSKILCYLRIAYATWGENPQAAAFRDHALKKLYEGKVLPVLLEFGAGGGFTECGWYTRHSLWHLVQALELARCFEGYDGFAKAPAFFYQRLAYELHQPYPGLGEYGAEHYACEGDGSAIYGMHTEYPRLTRTVLAQYFRGSELARYTASRQRRHSNTESMFQDFLLQAPGEEPLAIRDFPLSHLAAGIGKVYARSNWSEGATWFRFECGDHFNQHQHFEAGNFEIFRHAPLATESGEYVDWTSPHVSNWCIRTIAHNCILVYQPDEVWRNNRRPKDAPYANDGGQANNPSVADNLEQWKRERARHERGRIVAYENHPEFLHLIGDCTKAYAPSKVAQCLRQVLFIRPHTFVIFDRVASTKGEYEKTWLLHCRNEPKIEGPLSMIANSQGRLYVQTLLPTGAKVRKIEGYGYRGQSYEPAKHPLNAAANRWRLEVTPAQAQTHDLFLHVLSTEKAPGAHVEQTGGRVMVRGEGWNASLEANGSGTLTIAGKPYPIAPAIKKGRYE